MPRTFETRIAVVYHQYYKTLAHNMLVKQARPTILNHYILRRILLIAANVFISLTTYGSRR